MRCETPERIFFAADFAQVKPVGSDVMQLAQFPRKNHRLQFLDAGMVLQQMPNH